MLLATQLLRHRGVDVRKGGAGRKVMGRAPRCVGVGVVYERIAGTLTVVATTTTTTTATTAT